MELIDLGAVRRILMRLEDTIIFLMIERAQFAHNPVIYENSNKFLELEKDRETSFLGWMLRETERTHAKVRRYESPDEYPFTPRNELPGAILPPLDYPKFLHPNQININDEIKDFYINNTVPSLTKKNGRPIDDSHYGSSATRDVEILQAVSRRIHYGKFVAELKFRDHPLDFIKHIRERNSEELSKLITFPKVEEALLKRLEKKAMAYGQDFNDNIGNSGSSNASNQLQLEHKVDVTVVVSMYKDWVIPLTRKVEVDYLLDRLRGLSEKDLNDLIQKAK